MKKSVAGTNMVIRGIGPYILSGYSFMERVLDKLNDIIRFVFYFWLTALFYISVKKCYWTEGKSKAKLFLMSMFTSPLVIYLEAGLISSLILDTALSKYVDTSFDRGMQSGLSIIIMGVVFALFYLMMTLLFAWLGGKWLKVEKSSVVFLCLMYSTIYIISIKKLGADAYGAAPFLWELLDFTGRLIIYLAVWLFYKLDVLTLSEMPYNRVKVNWKVFILPPAIFTFCYTMFLSEMIFDADILEWKMILAIHLFSSVIVFLFIWAFHVIIKNLNATNVAIKAKEEAEKAREEVKELSVEVMEALAHTIDAKDEYTRGHSIRVAKYSRMIADKMGMSPEDSENVYYMGLLHDLGKIGVPNEIINSPTKLTDEQYDVIKTHPVLGYDILSEIKSRPDLVIGARWHHERYDGKGYPDGKSGEDIPIMARIIAVADSYDAMTSNRSYRKYMPQDKVRSEIEKNMGTQFDPKVAECMMQIMDEDKEYKLHE